MSQYSSTPPASLYEIRPVDSKTANALVVEHHYLHRRASTMYAWGLFEKEVLRGVIIYGKPASPAPCKGVCGPEEASHVIELTRLWCADDVVRNSESWLIGSTLKMLPTEFDIIISYAELDAGHTGLVYRASNWLFTGKSSKHIDWVLDGEAGKHVRHRLDEVGGIKKAKEVYGERLQPIDRPRKNRYVFFRGSKTRRRELRNKLRYSVQEYSEAS